MNGAVNQDMLDEIIDKNIQVVNCSQWDPTVLITMPNKNAFVSEVMVYQLINKRSDQIKSIRKGLQIADFLSYIGKRLELCASIFVSPTILHVYNVFLTSEMINVAATSPLFP